MRRLPFQKVLAFPNKSTTGAMRKPTYSGGSGRGSEGKWGGAALTIGEWIDE